MNWRTWSISAVDGNGQPFLFLVFAQDRASALADAEDDLAGLRVTDAHPIK